MIENFIIRLLMTKVFDSKGNEKCFRKTPRKQPPRAGGQGRLRIKEDHQDPPSPTFLEHLFDLFYY